MSHDQARKPDAAQINRDIKKYIFVFISLMVLSAVTVMTHYMHLGVALGIAVAFTVATIKGSMVAGYFMHLFHESPLLYKILMIMAIFFAVLMLLPILTYLDPVQLPAM